MTEDVDAQLAREARDAGLVVEEMTPNRLGSRFWTRLRRPDGALWIEGSESAEMVRWHIQCYRDEAAS